MELPRDFFPRISRQLINENYNSNIQTFSLPKIPNINKYNINKYST